MSQLRHKGRTERQFSWQRDQCVQRPRNKRQQPATWELHIVKGQARACDRVTQEAAPTSETRSLKRGGRGECTPLRPALCNCTMHRWSCFSLNLFFHQPCSTPLSQRPLFPGLEQLPPLGREILGHPGQTPVTSLWGWSSNNSILTQKGKKWVRIRSGEKEQGLVHTSSESP